MPKTTLPTPVSADTLQLMRDIEQGLTEAQQGLYAQIHSPADITKRLRGRPPLASHKEPVTLRLDPHTLAQWRASGKGWQTRAALVLENWLKDHSPV